MFGVAIVSEFTSTAGPTIRSHSYHYEALMESHFPGILPPQGTDYWMKDGRSGEQVSS